MSALYSVIPTSSRSLRGQRADSAFTLIELLTVVAVIGILALILIPVIGSVRERAKSAACLSNLKQFQLGNMLYAQNNGGRYVRIKEANGDWWFVQRDFLDYVGGATADGSLQAVRCQSIETLLENTNSAWERQYMTGYAYNSTGLTGTSSGPSTPVYQMSLPRPATTLAFVDGLDFHVTYADSFRYNGVESKQIRTTSYRHKNGANVVYWDGHSRYLKRDELDRQMGGTGAQKLWNMLAP